MSKSSGRCPASADAAVEQHGVGRREPTSDATPREAGRSGVQGLMTLAATAGLTRQRPAATRSVPLTREAPAGRLTVASASCQAFDDLGPHALAVTYWYRAPGDGGATDLVVTFQGRRLAGPDSPLPVVFKVQAQAIGIPARSGPGALTARVPQVAPGEWEVTAREISPHPSTRSRPARGSTRFAPLADGTSPGVVLGAWPLLVSLGSFAGLAVQRQLALAEGLPWVRVLALTLAACVTGLVGAKLYYRATHVGQHESIISTGLSLQGFSMVAIAVLLLGALVVDLPVGTLLDVSAPGLLLGIGIGRVGCLLGGCCAGRLTGGRFGLRSSDRRLLARRVPVQLLEATAAALVAGATAVLRAKSDGPAGAVFLAGFSAYLALRQLLFPLRSIPRSTKHGRKLTLGVSCSVLAATSLALALS